MKAVDSTQPVPVAIIGMGCLFPGAGDLSRYWANIRDRRDAIAEVPATHWRTDDYFDADPKAPDRTYARRGGFLAPVDFPALDFGIAPNNLDATDTTQLLGLMAARAALEDAGYGSLPGSDRAFDRKRVSVLLGVTGTLELVIPLGARLGHPIWRRALKAAGVADDTAEEVVRRISDSYVGWQENSFPGLLGNVAAGRIANRLDLGGTNCVIDAACASSLAALHLALHELSARQCDMALSGGLDTFNDIFMYMCFSKTPALSPSGDARPFDAAGDGTILGEGLGVLVLKRLDDARRDGDKVYAVIRGVGSSSDGKGGAVYAPSASGQAKALRRAYELAGVSPASVELVEAHGTGTKVGDATELAALAEVYREARAEGTWCALGSVKSQIGHTKAAAGAAGLIKAALALHHKVLPPTIKVTRPVDAASPGRSPFYVNTEPRPWMPSGDHPRRAAVSAFGFGGSNFHCVLEEAGPAMTAIDWDGDVQIVAFSAGTPDSLLASIDAWPRELELAWDALRVEAARARERFRATDRCRLLLVVERDATDLGRVVAKARALVGSGRGSGNGSSSGSPADGIYHGIGDAAGSLAMLFPGQGSQYPGMLRTLACRFPAFHDAMVAADATALDDGRRLGDLIYPHPAFDDSMRARQDAALRATEVAQPALGAVSLGVLAILEHFGVRPDAVAGHSYGELTALCAAGRIDAGALGLLSRSRGRLMADAGSGTGTGGAMLAVMAPLATIEAAIRDDELDVVVANKNAPEQAILSGPDAEIARAARRFEGRGISTRPLAVAAAFHSKFVAEARGPFAATLRAVEFRPARVPVYANATGAVYPEDHDQARALLADQLAQPVEFVAEVEAMYRSGVRTFVEVGPNRTLTGLVGAILGGRAHAAIAVDASRGRRDNLGDLARTLAQVAALGHPVRLTPWDGDHAAASKAERPEGTPRKPGLTVKVCGANVAPRAGTSMSEARPREEKEVGAGPIPPSVAVQPRTAEPLPGHPGPIAIDSRPMTPSKTNRDASSTMTPTPTPSARFPQPQVHVPPANFHGNGYGDPTAHATNGRNGTIPEHASASSPPNGAHSSAPFVPAPPPAPIPALRSNESGLLAEALRTTQDNLVALQKLGEQTAHLHRQFLDGQDRTRRTFQTLLEQQQKLVLTSLGLEPSSTASAPPTADPIPATLTPHAPRVPAEHRHESDVDRAPAPNGSARVFFESEPAELAHADEVDPALTPDGSARVFFESEPEVSAAPASISPVIATAETDRIGGVLMAIVSEKTGYPAEMLEPAMRLDADLGIDSIKRVEILAALQERLPDAPPIRPEHLGTLHTLGQIVDFLAAAGGAVSAQQPGPAPLRDPDPDPDREDEFVAPRTVPSAPIAVNHAAAAVQETLLAIVAEKTGYPAEMLEPAMRLDADLGIDSIKRVEILAALQERLPDAPAIRPEHLGTLHTLGQIVDFLAAVGPEVVGPSNEAEAEAEEPATPPLQRFVLSSVPLDDRQPRDPVRLRPGGEVWIGGDGHGDALATAIAGRLRARGYRPRLIGRGEVAGLKVPARLDGLLLLAPSSTTRPGDDDGSIKEAFGLLRAAGPALRQAGRDGEAALATVARLDGGFGTRGLGAEADPASGGLAGLSKTALHEWPEVACKAIDVDPAFARSDIDRAAEAILEEWLCRGPVEVGLTRQGRSTLELSPSPIATGRKGQGSNNGNGRVPTLVRGDVVVISGGARGITAEVAVALAGAFRPTVVLLGRSPAPAPEPEWLAALDVNDEPAVKRALASRANGHATPQSIGEQFRRVATGREIARTLARIEAAGARVIYRAIDVRDRAAVRACLATVVDEFGPVRALIHGAGVLADRRIEDQADAQFASVYDTKVDGLRGLLDAVGPDDLRALVLFSSTTARFGRAGQVAYASANEVLNKWARREASDRPGCRVVSINWGPWDGGMVNASLKPLFEAEGVALIPAQAGARALVAELEANERPVEVVILGGSSLPPGLTPATPAHRHEIPAPVSAPTPAMAPAPAPSPAPSVVFEQAVDVASIPVLRSHVIDGRPVLPMALILEWLAQGALRRNPGLVFRGAEEVRLLKGVIVRDDRPGTIRVLAGKANRDDGLYRVAVELRGTANDGRELTHARGAIVLGESLPQGEEPFAWPALAASGLDPRDFYRDLLFHGPDLRGIERVEGCDDRGIVAVCKTSPPPAAWLDRPLRQAWLTDPLAIDGIFQALILWSVERSGAGSLPTSIGRYRQFRRAFPPERVRIVARITHAGPLSARADIAVLDVDGALVARMDDYECVIDASLNQAFRRNQVTLVGS